MTGKISKFLMALLFMGINVLLLTYVLLLLSYSVTIIHMEFWYSDFIMFFMGGAVLFFFINMIFPDTVGFFLTFEHEFIHLVAALLTFHSIHSFKVDRRKGGMVKIKGQNFFIALSPYYIPLAVILLILLQQLSHFQTHPLWSVMFGFGEAFYLIRLLRDTHAGQPDFNGQGIVLSLFHVFVMNLLVQAVLFFYFSSQMSIIPHIVTEVNSRIWVVFMRLIA